MPSSALETRSYVYDSSWGDLLTKYNGKTVGHDAIGNMTSYNGSSYSWQGRELTKVTSGSNTYSYKYDADGIRTSKTVNGTKTEFFLNGSQILAQKTGDSVMLFFYDSTGKRVGFANGDTLYYYLYNVQGDVIAIMRAATGQVVARYSYDAWGKCTVTNATGYTVGEKNPFRYRGYYYDTETGLYYLNSRYYNPEFGRFISADNAISNSGKSVNGYNLFAYCFNNPVNMDDQAGNWPKLLESIAKAVAVAAVIVTAVVVVAAVTAGTGGAALVAGIAFGTSCGGLVGGLANERKQESFINGCAGGAANGFIQSVGTAAFGAAGTIGGGSIGSGVGTAITEHLNNKDKPKQEQKSTGEIVNESLKSAMIGAATSSMTAWMNYTVKSAVDIKAFGLMPELTPAFGEMMKGFFGAADDTVAYIFCE